MPFLPTDRIKRRDPTRLESDTPLLLVSKTAGAQRIMAADAAAQRHGLNVGMALAQARAMQPNVCVYPHDAVEDERLLERIADWSDRYTPLVGRDSPHGLILDITGCAHLLGGEHALLSDLIGRLARQGIYATAAIAPTVGAAWALSRCTAQRSLKSSRCSTQRNSNATILPIEISRADLDAALAPLPISGLRLDPATVAALRRVGLKRIGDLIGRPRNALAARFGAPLILRLDQARGIDTEAISPRQPVPPAVVEQGFAEPILATSAVERTCRHLTESLAAILEERGQGATALQLSVYRVDGLVKRIDLRLASPSRQGKTMADLLALRLGHLDDPLDPGFGYDLIRLAATAVASKDAEACELAGFDDQSGPVQLANACATLIDRLAARFGEERIHTFAITPTHIPEHASRLVQASTVVSKTSRQSSSDLARRPRPLRLFDPPEPIEVMAEVPDGPPIHLRWRRRPLRIVHADGPERIAPEWWRPGALATSGLAEAPLHDATRDYWRIEDASGRRLWLYREGFYGEGGAGPVPRQPRWYVHGLFA
jgi:protein ImuB